MNVFIALILATLVGCAGASPSNPTDAGTEADAAIACVCASRTLFSVWLAPTEAGVSQCVCVASPYVCLGRSDCTCYAENAAALIGVACSNSANYCYEGAVSPVFHCIP
jgi:hypothetical protein